MATTTTTPSFTTRLTSYIRAGYPAVAIETTEEPRALGDAVAAVQAAGKALVTWSITEGLRQILPIPKTIPDTQDPMAALGQLQTMASSVAILRDAQGLPWDRDPALARMLRDVIVAGPAQGSMVALLGPKFPLYPSIEKLVTALDYALPSEADLVRVVAALAESCGCPAPKASELADVVRALGGLSVSEAENALALAYIETKSFSPAIIYREKTASVRRSGLLEIVSPDPRGLDSIGGLSELKKWIGERRSAYSPEAEAYGLPSPKGCLIVGLPGTGKSLAAKALGAALGIPTLKLDIGSLFGSLVGQSEQRAREALQLAEALSPCVLWLDEIDKGLGGASGSGAGDSGTTKRVFGTILSWLQEKRRPVFMVATANTVGALPPEFYRRGRWDEIWSVDLPGETDRADIAEVQIRKHVRAPKAAELAIADIEIISAATQDFTGAEIEAAVVSALFGAFADGQRAVTSRDIVVAAQQIVPLATMAKAQLAEARSWAKGNARDASFSMIASKPVKAGRRIG